MAKVKCENLTELNRELKKINSNLNRVIKEVPEGNRRTLLEGANKIRNTIILSMRNTPKDGREYKRGGKTHIASSAGNPPAVDSGELLRSIIFDVRGDEIEVGNEAGAYYGGILEEGYEKGNRKMEARPWLDPAVEKHKNEILRDIYTTSIETLKKTFKDRL